MGDVVPHLREPIYVAVAFLVTIGGVLFWRGSLEAREFLRERRLPLGNWLIDSSIFHYDLFCKRHRLPTPASRKAKRGVFIMALGASLYLVARKLG